jgi:RNA polymerase sigma-70 factor (ECF subfamily)
MSFLREVPFEGSRASRVRLQSVFGFVPNLFYAQSLIPRVIEAEAELLSAIVSQQEALSRIQKECIFLIASNVYRNDYCVTLHHERLRSLGMTGLQIESLLSADYRLAGLAPREGALLDFSLRLIRDPTRITSTHIDQLRKEGFQDQAILETTLSNGLARMLCTVSAGLAPDHDFEPRQIGSVRVPDISSLKEFSHAEVQAVRPYLHSPELSAKDYAPFAFFEKRLGVVPNLFRAQTLRPDIIEAEARAAELIVANEEVLPQWKKECILLVSAAANLNMYCVAAHCAMLRRLRFPPEEADQIAVDHNNSNLANTDKALLDFTLKLSVQPAEISKYDIDSLYDCGFDDEQILEAVVTAGFGNFLNTVVAGLGVVPDFESKVTLQQKHPAPSSQEREAPVEPVLEVDDPDASLVARVQAGEVQAFEELVRRHQQRVYRTMMGILRDPEVAQDAVQDAFLRAFKHIRDFRGRSKFATWLMTISRNSATQFLRDREEMESLDDRTDDEEGFRPRQVRAWQDNPEDLCSKNEMRDLVERELLKLPPKYRVVIMLRDIEQLPTNEVAAGLNLTLAGVKARLFRARLMLRDALAPRFAVSGGRLNA